MDEVDSAQRDRKRLLQCCVLATPARSATHLHCHSESSQCPFGIESETASNVRTAAGQDVVVAQQLADEREQNADANAGARDDQRHRPVGQVLGQLVS